MGVPRAVRPDRNRVKSTGDFDSCMDTPLGEIGQNYVSIP